MFRRLLPALAAALGAALAAASEPDPLGDGYRYLREERPDRAAEAFEIALSADRASAEAAKGLVLALARDGRTDEALRAAQRHLEGTPDAPRAWALLGRAFLHAGRFDEAEQAFLEAASLGESGEAEWGLGRLAATRGRHAEAAARFARAHRMAPADPEILEAWLRSIDDPEVEKPGWSRWLATDLLATESSREFVEALLPVFDRYAARRGARPALVEGRSLPVALPLVRLGRLQGTRLDERRVALPVVATKGKSKRLLLDSGARGITLSPSAARAAGFKPLASFRLHGFGGGGRGARARLGTIERLEFGPFVLSDAIAVEIPTSSVPEGVDGIVGLDLFAEHLFELDLGVPELRILPAEPDGAEDDRFAAVPTRRLDAHLLVEVVVASRTKGWFLLDTGASHTVLDLPLAEGLGGRTRQAELYVQGVGGVLKDLRTAPEAHLEAGGMRRRDPGLLAYPLSGVSRRVGVHVAGVLGLSFLEGRILRVDYGNARVLLRETEGGLEEPGAVD